MAEGPPLSRRRFEGLVRRLPPEGLVAFVADLWTLRGWDTTVRDGLVLARDRGEERRLLVYRERRLLPDDVPDLDAPADAVVTTGRGGGRAAAVADGLDADLVTVDDLYDATMYAVDRTASKALLWDHFGDAAAPGAVTSAAAGSAGRRLGGAATLLVAGALVLALVAGAAGLLPGGEPGAAPDGTTTVAGPTSALVRGGAQVEVPTADPGPAATTTAPPTAQRASAAVPNCDRTPADVTEVVTAALRANDPEDGLGVRTAWRFLTPGAQIGFGSQENFERTLDGETYRPVLNATAATFGPTIRTDDATATRRLTVEDADGNESRYEFRLVRQTDSTGADCWRVDTLTPLPTDGSPGEVRDSQDPTDVYPNCRRPPDEVARTFVRALRHNDPETDDGFAAARRFLTPAAGTAFGSQENFRRTLGDEAYAALLNGSNASYGPTTVEDDRAVQRVNVTAADGANRTYYVTVLRVSTGTGENCWRVDNAVAATLLDERSPQRRPVDPSRATRT